MARILHTTSNPQYWKQPRNLLRPLISQRRSKLSSPSRHTKIGHQTIGKMEIRCSRASFHSRILREAPLRSQSQTPLTPGPLATGIRPLTHSLHLLRTNLNPVPLHGLPARIPGPLRGFSRWATADSPYCFP
jgi:hypothetical protein